MKIKRIFAFTAMLCAVSMQSFADSSNCIWLKALTYPANAGGVYVDFDISNAEPVYTSTSEFKRVKNMGVSDAFILAEPASNEWLFAGVARDMNLDGVYNADTDRQIHVWYNYYFTAFYDHTDYFGQSTTESDAKAMEALNLMTKPTDQVIAVFTKGAVAYRAEDEEAFGYVFSSKLYNEPGDQVTFYAYGDVDSRKSPNSFYKFDCWRDANGQEVSRDREFTITVKGMEVYYAHFVKTTKADYEENEKAIFPQQFKWDYNNTDWNPLGIESINVASPANQAVYDLQGRKVSTLKKGVFVQNGKKFVVR